MKQVIVNKWLTSINSKSKLQIGLTIGCLSEPCLSGRQGSLSRRETKKFPAGIRLIMTDQLLTPVLTPVARTTRTGDICRKMVTHLIRGDWGPGEQIPPERELCLRLGVGRASLREALKALEDYGDDRNPAGRRYLCMRAIRVSIAAASVGNRQRSSKAESSRIGGSSHAHRD